MILALFADYLPELIRSFSISAALTVLTGLAPALFLRGMLLPTAAYESSSARLPLLAGDWLAQPASKVVAATAIINFFM